MTTALDHCPICEPASAEPATTRRRGQRPNNLKWLDNVRAAQELSSSAVLAAHVLACEWMDYVTLRCWPAVQSVADAMHVNHKTARRAIHELTTAGYLRVERRGGGRSHQTTHVRGVLPGNKTVQ